MILVLSQFYVRWLQVKIRQTPPTFSNPQWWNLKASPGEHKHEIGFTWGIMLTINSNWQSNILCNTLVTLLSPTKVITHNFHPLAGIQKLKTKRINHYQKRVEDLGNTWHFRAKISQHQERSQPRQIHWGCTINSKSQHHWYSYPGCAKEGSDLEMPLQTWRNSWGRRIPYADSFAAICSIVCPGSPIFSCCLHCH